jgi:hypothetical protein
MINPMISQNRVILQENLLARMSSNTETGLVILGEDQQNGDLHFPVWFEFQFLASGN